MADTNITFTIPQAKVQRVIDAMKGLYPIPETDGKSEFTDNQWAKEAVRRFVVNSVQRWENKVTKDAAEVEPDNTIIS